jgi:hypothetical protein
MSAQIVYIPNLVGGQAIQINQSDDEYTIQADSLSSNGFILDKKAMRGFPVNFGRPGSAPSSTSSSSTTFIPDDAF